MLTKTDAKQQVHYSYDQYGRLSDVYRYAMINGQLTEQTAQRVHYYYDSNPIESGFSSNANGRLAAVEMPDENANYGRVFYYEYSYSQSGRVNTQRMRVVGDIQGVSSPINFDASYGWDQEGRMTSLNYPSTGPQYSYRYGPLGRLSSLFETGNASPSATVTYGNAGQVLGMTYWAVNETRQYNSLLQMTSMTATAFGTTVMDNQYNFTAGQKNGRITSSVDGFLSNETVNYTYDALNRLSSATATNSAWGQSFTYDGFGNMTDKNQTVGSAPSLHVTFDPATNRQTGVNYDANGNPTEGKIYDVENRIIGEPGYQWYTYDYRGKRITKLMGSTTELYFYGIDGRKLATYQCAAGTQQNNYQFTYSSPAFDTYWKGKLVKSKGQEVTTDRLGSVRWARDDGWRAYWPYGEERWGSNDNREKFGTYVRDNSTQDYADQRYYGPGTGRFHTPDPYLNSAGAGDPTSWNRYAYVQGDPMNGADPSGNNTILVSDLSIDLFKTFYTVPGVSITVTATFDPITPGATEILSLIREGDELLEGPRQKDKPPEDTGFSTPCWALPAGALLAASGSVGLLGGQSASGALFADYDNGHLYVSVSFGLQAGWNGGAAGNVSVGNVYGPNGATQSVMTGGGISLQVGAGPFVAGVQGSGPGLASPNPLLTDLANGIALTVGTGWSLFQTQFSGGVSPSSTPLVVDLGSFMQTGSGANSAVTTASPTIALGMMAAYVARQACH